MTGEGVPGTRNDLEYSRKQATFTGKRTGSASPEGGAGEGQC